MNTFSTPMMRQYQEIKEQYADCLLFYRMGDFYELFMEDAKIGSQILNITLTSKSGGKDGKIPMAGVPYHAVDSYIAKLVKAGFKVAICEQLSPPNKRGIVKRDVVRIVTPGTLLDEQALEKKENNYIVSILLEDTRLALSAADLSTGFFAVSEVETEDTGKVLLDELTKLHPSECILPEALYNDPAILKLIKVEKGINIYPASHFPHTNSDARKILLEHFQLLSLSAFGMDNKKLALMTAAALLSYLKETQKGNISHIRKITSLTDSDGLILDRSSMINLELFSTIRDHDTRGSLLFVIDQTVTAMGGRLLKQWMKKPLAEKKAIEERFDAIDSLLSNPALLEQLRLVLREIPDIERLISRLSVGLGNARDLVNLKSSLERILQVKDLLAKSTSKLLQQQATAIPSELKAIAEIISSSIVDEPPITTREGRMIREGRDKDLDRLRSTIGKSKEWILEMEKTEREKTGINSLKVRFNRVFGFYIEVSKSNLSLVPDRFMRKQTLVNGERFITEELKEHEEIILSAEEKIFELEYQLFTKILTNILTKTREMQDAAESIGVIDCLSTFAQLAESNRYTRPKLLYSGEMRIKEGRHPVVEKLVDETPFVPNDVTLDNINQSLLLITGPNMAGKSVFIRQVALIVLMAQMGCFVPASTAHLSIVDRIFVRSGASDVITSGLSTFMVEMVETAHILNHATDKSLIIMDEIGRGTSTYDGISIAFAVAEYLATHFEPTPKVLFATHYHELQSLEQQYPQRIRNFHMAVADQKGEPIFLHSILPGGASHSFGVAVARLAGVPEEVIERAYEMLQTLEYRGVTEKHKTYFSEEKSPVQESSGDNLLSHMIQKELSTLDIATMTPLEALNRLSELKEQLKLFASEKSLQEVD